MLRLYVRSWPGCPHRVLAARAASSACSRLVPSQLNALARKAAEDTGSLEKLIHQDLQQPDILCLQEVKYTDANVPKDVACIAGYESFFHCCAKKKGYSGVATYVRLASGLSPVSATRAVFDDPGFDDEGRVMATDHGAFVLLNVYVPNGGQRPERARLPYKLEFLARLRELMDKHVAAGKGVVLAGDLNIAHAWYDTFAHAGPWHGYSGAEIDWMDQLVGPPPAVGPGQSTCSQGPATSDCSVQAGVASGAADGTLASQGSARDSDDSDWIAEVLPRKSRGSPSSSIALQPAPSQQQGGLTQAPASPGSSSLPDVGAGSPARSAALPAGPMYVDTYRSQRAPPRAAFSGGDITRGGQFTCWDWRSSARAHNRGLRIDYLVVDRAFAAAHVRPGSAAILASAAAPHWSDHVPVAVVLRQVPLPAPHDPLPMSSAAQARYRTPTTLLSFFAPAGQKRARS